MRLGEQRLGRDQLVEEAPALALLAAERAAGVEELAGAALADDARQDRAGAHVAAGQANAIEKERRLAARGAQTQVGSHRQDGARAGTHAVNCSDDRLRARAHRLHQLARHAREHQQFGRLQLHERTDDLVHITAGAEVVARTGQHDGFDVIRPLELMEQVAQLGIRIERERVLALRPVERDGGNTAFHAPQEMLGLITRQRAAVAGQQGRVHRVIRVGHGWVGFVQG